MRKIKTKKVKHPKVSRLFTPLALETVKEPGGGPSLVKSLTLSNMIAPEEGAKVPLHLAYAPNAFAFIMAEAMAYRRPVTREDVAFLKGVGEIISELGPENPNEIRKNLAYLDEAESKLSKETGLEAISKPMGGLSAWIVNAFTSLSAHAFFGILMWREMGKNIIELDPYLMDALLRTEINVIPDDLHLPITPIYLAIPSKRLEIYEGYFVDGFMLEEIDYEEMPGEIVEGTAETDVWRNAPLQTYYQDDYIYPFMGIKIRYGCVRNLRVTIFRNIPANVPFNSDYVNLSNTPVGTFIIPLDYDDSMGDYLQRDERLNAVLEGIEALQSPVIWIRTILNSLLYFNSEGADKKEVAGLTSQQKSKLSAIKNKKAREKFVERNKAPYNIIKIGSSFSEKPVFGKGKPISSRFIVRGHWRKQRVGKGRKQIKLLWIKPHIKGKDLETTGKTRIYQNPHD